MLDYFLYKLNQCYMPKWLNGISESDSSKGFKYHKKQTRKKRK